MIFKHKIGFSIDSILDYYMGNDKTFITPKSTLGILKSLLPHIFAFGLLSMVLLHFIVFTKQRYKKITKILVYLIYSSATLEILSSFLLVQNIEFFAYIKLLSLLSFEVSILYVLYILIYSIIKD
jgi:hypothetical protein